MSKKKKIIAFSIIFVCILLTVVLCYLHLSEKYMYNVKVDIAAAAIGCVVCFSYVIWEGYTLGKRMQAMREEEKRR